MKHLLSYKHLFITLIAVVTFSCTKDTEKPTPDKQKDSYLVEYKKVKEAKKSDLLLTAAAAVTIFGGNIDLSFVNHISNDVEMYVVKYNTTFQGKKVIASGLVSIPKSDATFPILSFQNGTNVEHKKAPSADYNSTLAQFSTIISSTGFIVSIPDYLGFGASKDMFHPYLHKESTSQSIIDMLKAVKELTDGKVDAKSSKDLYMAGYSQGGWATMCLQKTLEIEHPELFNLVASSCGAGPYRLNTVISYLLKQTTYHTPYMIANVFNTMLKTGVVSEETINTIVKEPYASKITSLFDGVQTAGEINSQLSTNISEIIKQDFIDNFETSPKYKAIRDDLEKNSIGFWKTSVPTKLFHGTTDKTVPLATSEEAYSKMTQLGVTDSTLEFLKLPNKNHSSAILPTEMATLIWFLQLKNN